MVSPRRHIGRASPAILSISSHVVRGSVGNRSAVFALEALGFPVWSMPTVILPYHPGHGPSTRMKIEASHFGPMCRDLLMSPWASEIGAVLTGYFAGCEQVSIAAEAIARLKAGNPQLIYCLDPVIGDYNGLYVEESLAVAIRDLLLPLADIATPNLFELSWLAGAPIPADPTQAQKLAQTLPCASIALTSAPALMRGNIANLMITGDMSLVAEHRRVDGPSNGAGDIFAALLLARIMAGIPPEKALEKASASVFEMMARAAARGDDELMPETDLASIVRPVSHVQMRHLSPGHEAARRRTGTAKNKLGAGR